MLFEAVNCERIKRNIFFVDDCVLVLIGRFKSFNLYKYNLSLQRKTSSIEQIAENAGKFKSTIIYIIKIFFKCKDFYLSTLKFFITLICQGLSTYANGWIKNYN